MKNEAKRRRDPHARTDSSVPDREVETAPKSSEGSDDVDFDT